MSSLTTSMGQVVIARGLASRQGSYQGRGVAWMPSLCDTPSYATNLPLPFIHTLLSGLRDPTSQRQLALLAAVPNVHLAASVDHVNAALLWDLQVGGGLEGPKWNYRQ